MKEITITDVVDVIRSIKRANYILNKPQPSMIRWNEKNFGLLKISLERNFFSVPVETRRFSFMGVIQKEDKRIKSFKVYD